MSNVEVIHKLNKLDDVIDQLIASNVDLTAVIAELQLANISLTSSLTQLTTQNTTLSSQLTELLTANATLSSQLTQATTANTNLAAAIAELVLVNTALVTVNTRALDNTDIPNIPLPYESKVIKYSINGVSNGVTTDFIFKDTGSAGGSTADWGAGKDFYPILILVDIASSPEPIQTKGQGFWIQSIAARGGGPNEVIFGKSFNYLTFPFHKAFGSAWWHFESFLLAQTRINSNDSLLASIVNHTGVTLTTVSFSIVGVTI